MSVHDRTQARFFVEASRPFGAQARDMLRMVIWRGMRLTLIDAALEVAAGLAC
ncbi:MAG TPA: hypothetical protein VE715_13965 [Blastocatellia bacterium]|nr:hypothetical protein [Blastocatellia bacterium]